MRSLPIAILLALIGTSLSSTRADSKDETAQTNEITGVVRDEADELLWRGGLTPNPSLSQQQFADAATQSISLLAQLRSWREILRTNGAKRRQIADTTLMGEGLGVSLGAAAPTQSGVGGAGLAAHWGNLEIGSTLNLRALDGALETFDEALTGREISASSQPTRSTWLRAKAIENQNGFLEFSALQSARDRQAGEGETWQKGRFASARAKWNLPKNWSASGDFTRAQVEDGEAKNSWKTNLGGPLAHPFGVARAEVNVAQTEAGFENLSSQNLAGERKGDAKLTQDLALGPLAGQLQVGANDGRRDDIESARAGETLRTQTAQTQADLRLRVSPKLALKAVGNAQTRETETALANGAPANGGPAKGDSPQAFALEAPPAMRDETQILGGDVGLEWRFSPALKLGITAGKTQTNRSRRMPTASSNSQDSGSQTPNLDAVFSPSQDDFAGENEWLELPGSEENRGIVELRHQTGDGAFGVKYARRERENGETRAWSELDTLRLEAERRLIGSFRVRTILDFARDRRGLWNDERTLARRAEAQLSLNRKTRLDLRLRDGAALPSDLLSDAMGNPFGALGSGGFQTGNREFAARFNAGATDGSGGLSLALEYARQSRVQGNSDSWKVGLTFR